MDNGAGMLMMAGALPSALPKNTLLLRISQYMFDRIEYGDFKVEQLLNPCDINILASSCDYEALERCFKRLMAYSIILAPLYKSATFEEKKNGAWSF